VSTSDHHAHRDVQGGGARAAVFGVSDGLVTNVSLILGMAGAHPSTGIVRLAGMAGLIAGACSMAAGEYVSMRAQTELVQRELDVERRSLRRSPQTERDELRAIYESRGIAPALASELVDEMMQNEDLALETHAREELGVDPEHLGSPVQAAAASFVTFGAGAVLPLLPWFFSGGTGAALASVVIGAFAALTVGAVLGLFTSRSVVWSALRQLVVVVVAAGITFGIGRAIGTGVS